MSDCEYIYNRSIIIFGYNISFLKRKYYFLKRPKILIEKYEDGDWFQVYPKVLK